MTRLHAPYRSRDDIRYTLLNCIKEYERRGGVHRTRLMMLANITNVQLQDHLQKMLTNELIWCDSSKVRHVAASRRRGVTKVGDTFHITSKGEKYLDMVNEMKRSVGEGIKI